ncbi:hypothetical protein V9K67_03715 [Paraflavisolibacter sp. H34]|uniref:hypothetical protein n=1 Tax=Huijunlia imazamoxiresistens TaxID=3127457 RepID=UPI003019169D
MDIRQTLVVHASFIPLLKQLKESHQKASLLVDENGLSREEGYVAHLLEGEGAEDTLVHLDNGKVITLKSIVAVNGTFLSDYSEC